MGNNFVNRAQCLCALSHASILTYFQSCLDQYLSPPLSNANVSFICNTVRFSWDSLLSSIGSPDLLDGFLTLCILKFCLLFVCPTQSRPTLCDPTDCSPLGSSIHGIFQARVLQWGAIAFSKDILKERKFLRYVWLKLGTNTKEFLFHVFAAIIVVIWLGLLWSPRRLIG